MRRKRHLEDRVILLAEDWEPDVMMVQRAFGMAGMRNPLQVVRDGEEAVSYLAGLGQFADRTQHPFPDMLLLDLKLPRMDGFEVLRWVRSQPGGDKLPVVVLTSSQEVYHVHRAYALGANSFLLKPFEFENYPALARTMGKIWLGLDDRPQYIGEDLVEETPANSDTRVGAV